MLSSKNRPTDIQKWIKGHRKATEMPDVSLSVDSFAQEWRAWWDFLNPERDPASGMSLDVSEYSELRKAGPNGIFLLLLSLVWWGAAATDQGNEKMDVWRKAIGELVATVNFFNKNLTEPPERKRSHGDSEGDSLVKKYVLIWLQSMFIALTRWLQACSSLGGHISSVLNCHRLKFSLVSSIVNIMCFELSTAHGWRLPMRGMFFIA